MYDEEEMDELQPLTGPTGEDPTDWENAVEIVNPVIDWENYRPDFSLIVAQLPWGV